VLASGQGDALQPAILRAFELLLLREIGLLPVLDAQTLTLAPLDRMPTSYSWCPRRA
jgi:DNA repair protein RecO (recombination protein O)